MNPIYIKATTLEDAWYQCLYRCDDEGRDFMVDSGSFSGQKRKEFDYITIRIMAPGTEPLLPQIREGLNIPPPVDQKFLAEYLVYLMEDCQLKENESYTYGERIKPQIDVQEADTTTDGCRHQMVYIGMVSRPWTSILLPPENGGLGAYRFFLD